MDWFTDFIVHMLNAMGGDIFGGTRDTLTTSVADYSNVAFEAMNTIAETVVRPISAVVLSLLMVVELSRVSTHVEGDNQMGVKLIAGTMFKFVLLLIAVQHAPMILEAILEVATQIIVGIDGQTPSGDNDDVPALGSAMREHVDEADLMSKVGLLILLLIPFLVASAAALIAIIVATLRFFELYLLSAFATLPVAFIANPETKSIAVGYLRHFGAAAIHGATLMLVLFLYGMMATGTGMGGIGGVDTTLGEGENIAGWAVSQFLPLTGMGLLAIFMILGSNRLAKAIVGL